MKIQLQTAGMKMNMYHDFSSQDITFNSIVKCTSCHIVLPSEKDISVSHCHYDQKKVRKSRALYGTYTVQDFGFGREDLVDHMARSLPSPCIKPCMVYI